MAAGLPWLLHARPPCRQHMHMCVPCVAGAGFASTLRVAAASSYSQSHLVCSRRGCGGDPGVLQGLLNGDAQVGVRVQQALHEVAARRRHLWRAMSHVEAGVG